MNETNNNNNEDSDDAGPGLNENGGNEDRFEQQPDTTRRRHSMLPFDMNLFGSAVVTRLREVSISTLMQDDVQETNNMNRFYLDVQILRVITPSPNQNAVVYNRGRRANTQQIGYNRIILCRVHSESNSVDNSRLVYFMEARNVNDKLWNRNPEYRDDGTITVGTFIRVLAPIQIERMMQEIPLVRTDYPIIVMQAPPKLPTIQINNEIQGHGALAFISNGAHLSINRITVRSTTCGGCFCDKQRINDWIGTRGCGCYGVAANRSNLAIVHTIVVAMANGEVRTMNDFSSTKFSQIYLSNRIPADTRESSLQFTDAFFTLESTVDQVIDFINENGGFTVFGWYKRGIINDTSLVGMNTGNNNEEIQVDSGNINFHIVQLVPTNRDFHDFTSVLGVRLQRMKFDITQISHI